MRRIDLREIEDQSWCPGWIRDAMTGYLQVVIETVRPYDVAVEPLSRLLDATGGDEIVDLASGAGGPWRQLARTLRSQRPGLRVTLSDLNPNSAVADELRSLEGIDYLPDPVSALDPPADLGRVRTMFTSLHHLDEAQVRQVFTAAQRDRAGFAAFEVTQRSFRGLLITLAVPLLVLLLMPRVRPLRPVPLILTYLPPLLPLLIWWDGFASTLRTHTAEELRAIAAEITEPGYVWEIDEVAVPGGPVPVLQVIGRPTDGSAGDPSVHRRIEGHA